MILYILYVIDPYTEEVMLQLSEYRRPVTPLHITLKVKEAGGRKMHGIGHWFKSHIIIVNIYAGPTKWDTVPMTTRIRRLSFEQSCHMTLRISRVRKVLMVLTAWGLEPDILIFATNRQVQCLV